MFRVPLVDVSKPVGSFNVLPAGKIGTSASFAEIIIDRDDSREFELSVVFHLNGTDIKSILPGLRIANTDLLFHNKEQEYYYYPYEFNYKKSNAHLDKALDSNQIGAGTIVPLRYEKPDVNSKRSFFSIKVSSDMQQQGAFCSVSNASYGSTPAQSWDLREFNGKCVKLKGKAETEGH